jgi:hypothetical protein
MNDIIDKLDEGKTPFLRSLIYSFKKYKERGETGDEASVFRARSSFNVFCKGCLGVNRS